MSAMWRVAGCIVITLALNVQFSLANESLKAEFDSTFDKMLDAPDNVELSLKYANLAKQLGDFEASIPPLERMLMFYPESVDVMQQLGESYYHLKSYDVAKQYFLKVMHSKQVSPDALKKSQEYMSRMQ